MDQSILDSIETTVAEYLNSEGKGWQAMGVFRSSFVDGRPLAEVIAEMPVGTDAKYAVLEYLNDAVQYAMEKAYDPNADIPVGTGADEEYVDKLEAYLDEIQDTINNL